MKRASYPARVNWDDLRFFLVLARRGTLSAAARELGVSQPTVGRRIAALERRVGAKLFLRNAEGFSPSASGAAVLQLAEQMEQSALAAERRLAGRDEGVRGKVRITASEWLVTHVLSRLTRSLMTDHPELSLELIADARHVNLTRREADMALRPRRFDQASIVQRATCRLGFAVYASVSYLSERGVPDVGHGRCHVLIGMSDDVGDVARAWLGQTLPEAKPSVKTNGRDAMVTLAESGVGLACLPRIVGDASPSLRRLESLPPPPTPTLWLGLHRDSRQTPRVRAVASYLAQSLRALEAKLCPV
jgi:DNA-binding transcriptional LysR family regulator